MCGKIGHNDERQKLVGVCVCGGGGDLVSHAGTGIFQSQRIRWSERGIEKRFFQNVPRRINTFRVFNRLGAISESKHVLNHTAFWKQSEHIFEFPKMGRKAVFD